MSSKANAKNTRLKGKGWFVAENNVIYLQGTVEGHGFKRKSWGREATKPNLAYIKKNYRDVLLQLLDKDAEHIRSDFESFGRKVVEDGAKARSEHNQRDLLSKFERFVVPYFKKYDLGDIKAMHIEAWQEELLQDYSTSTVSKCKSLLRMIMHKACANDIIMKNPVEYADKFSLEFKKKEPYAIEDAKKLMKESKGWMHTYLNLAFTTGMRTGELMGLMWDDVDFDYSCIYLQRSVSKGHITIGSSGGKNHYRVVPVLPAVLEILRQAKEEANCKWLFPTRKLSYFRESKTIVKSHFKPLLEKLGIEYKTLYATRHTFSSIATNLGVKDRELDDMMGNSETVRNKHYNTFEMNASRSEGSLDALSPVNNAFFNEKKAEVK